MVNSNTSSNVKGICSLLLFSWVIVLSSCGTLSFRNIPNDIVWSTKVFDQPMNVQLVYTPDVIIQFDSTASFYQNIEVDRIEEEYNIVPHIVDKFRQRNVFLTTSDQYFSVVIDTLVFEEFYQLIDVYDNEFGDLFIGEAYADYFVFRMTGRVRTADSLVSHVSITQEHKTSPRESYLIPGLIINEGRGAKPTKMIENAINKFSHQCYLKLNDYMKENETI